MLGSFHHIDIRESFSCRWKGSNCFCRTRHFSASLGKKYSCLLYLSSLNRSMHMPTVDYFHMFQVIDHIWTVLVLYRSKFCYFYRMWERGSIVFTYISLSSNSQPQICTECHIERLCCKFGSEFHIQWLCYHHLSL